MSSRGDCSEGRSAGGLSRRCSLFGRARLGDPGHHVTEGVRRARERLRAQGLGGEQEPTVDGLVVFTNPAVKLKIEGCSPTVTGPKQLRNHVRGAKGPLNQQAVGRVVQALQA